MQSMNRRSFVKGAAALSALAAVVPAAAFAADAASSSKDKKKAASSASEKPVVAKAGELQIFAANSLEKALPEVQKLYSAAHPEVTFADTQFKASGDLVQQMKAGAKPDILITASKGTMDTAEEEKLVDTDSRITMFNNDLVIVRASGSDVAVEAIEDVVNVDKIAVGDAATVPAGKYANQALASVGLYTNAEGTDGEYDASIADKINLADKVGTAAKWVSTGDCQLGFVYSSDVYRYDGIEVAYTTPEDSHKKIAYPGAVAADAVNADVAVDFLQFCMTDPDALEVWSEYGFEVADE